MNRTKVETCRESDYPVKFMQNKDLKESVVQEFLSKNYFSTINCSICTCFFCSHVLAVFSVSEILIGEMGNTWPGDMRAQESGNLQMLRYDKIA